MIAVIDCCGSNIASVKYALERIEQDAVFTSSPEIVKAADCVLLPGVGSASVGMEALRKHNLIETIRHLTQPVLGICLGMQLLFNFSEEGDVPCLGIIDDVIKRFPKAKNITIPHMGWNKIIACNETAQKLIQDLDHKYVYFVHSFYAPVSKYTLTKTHHGISFSSIVKKDNFYGFQFHPEKSGAIGEKLFNYFMGTSNNL